MIELENLVMLSGENCSGCEISKAMFKRYDVDIKILDVKDSEASDLVKVFRVRSLPTFINQVNYNMLSGSYPLEQLIELNEE